MAWRLDDAIEHGLIDNTVEGITTGKIWLAGRDEPLILSLNGDCWRDLAGSVLEFENPTPRFSAEANALDTEQTGIIGDITASRKARIPSISDAEISEYHRSGKEVPCQWRNTLYLEWFSEINGRVLVEAVGYKMEVSEREWDMDEDAEEAQKLANLSTMRDFMAQVISRMTPEDDGPNPGSTTVKGELNEFEWEERLKESDRLTDAYQEVLEKYLEDPDSEQKEAFVMGWDALLGAMAERDENGEDFDAEFEFEETDFSNDWQSADDDEEVDDSWLEESHPLQIKAREVAIRAFDIVSRDEDPESPSQRLVSNVMQVSAKLAGVLHGRGSGYEPEAGFTLAVLKRCLNWINEAVGACNDLTEDESDSDQLAALNHLKADIFEIRDGIIVLRKELKQS
ncbi:hypothetical protein ACFSSA_02000 [Luteolibacter algae]|uniref:Uncharacterized protein n=1 Tax=Luteolibacter algae TaxID=454151 RepID=A0ABW5D628_9BACT